MRPLERKDDLSAAESSPYVDCPGTTIVVVALFIVVGSCLDAYFTLLHLQNGAREANPLMNFAIEVGPLFFLALKSAITGAGVLALVAVRQRRLRALGLGTVALCYCVLLTYHAALFFQHGGI
jgi:hypothetical protein